MNSRFIVLQAFVAVSAFGLFGCSRSDETAKPGPAADSPQATQNVVLITLDSTRADRLSTYGYDRPTSPRLDALAADGVKFEFAIAQSGLTPVSLASILTGMNPYEHGLRVMHGRVGYQLPSECVTLAEQLKTAGCATGAFVGAFSASQRFSLEQGFDTFTTGFDAEQAASEAVSAAGRVEVGSFQCHADEVTRAASEWIEKQPGRFFVWLHFFDPHDAGLVPPADAATVFEPRSASEDDARRAAYETEIHYMDAQIGRLIDTLRQRNLYDETVIVVVASQGTGLGEHGWWGGEALWQPQLHVPLLVRIPGKPAGKAIPDLVRTIDVAATIREAVGLVAEGEGSGLSLMNLIDGEPDAEPRFAYADLRDIRSDYARAVTKDGAAPDRLYCVMDRDWKLIFHELRPAESDVFYLEVDPNEEKNVVVQYPEQSHRLLMVLLAMAGEADKLSLNLGADDDAMKALEELGYLSGSKGGSKTAASKPAEIAPSDK
ncbi:MAG: sulfatase [Phycisphaerae bacterium]|nr:sulfatase [Phycisphaerae bacterium]